MPLPYLPAELLDHTVDHLHDARVAPKSCCLTSKSWVPRTRKHLFAKVTFKTAARLQSWKTSFPDPPSSPARYTKDLVVWCPELVTAADAEERGWIRAFSQVVHLDLDFDWSKTSLLPFHGLSLTLKSLHLDFGCVLIPRVLNLIHSFPLFEDLSLIVWGDDPIEDFNGQHTVVQPLLARSLTLDVKEGMNRVVSQLFPSQNDLRFRELDLALICEEDVFEISALVERCRFTLESLKVGNGHCDEESLGSIDLLKATGLKNVALKWKSSPRWAASTLRTITQNHTNLQQISFEIHWDFMPDTQTTPPI